MLFLGVGLFMLAAISTFEVCVWMFFPPSEVMVAWYTTPVWLQAPGTGQSFLLDFWQLQRGGGGGLVFSCFSDYF